MATAPAVLGAPEPPFEVIVIGAGPAGLAASAALASTHRTLLVEAGPALTSRDRHAPPMITAGVGGAGLFSDGKFSFYPAASRLWQLADPAALRAAYARLSVLLARHGLPCPALPVDLRAPDAPLPGRWSRKDYPSHYLPLAAREALTTELFAPSASPERHLLSTRATLLPPLASGLHRLRLDGPQGSRLALAHHVVLAGGRFLPWSGDEAAAPRWPSIFRRLEFGARIEDRSDARFFAQLAGVDPKVRWSDGEVEWRTFCMCRDGEVVMTESSGLWTASGRADGPATGRSSVSLLTRVLDEVTAQRLAPPLFAAARQERARFRLGLRAALTEQTSATLAARLGDEGAALLQRGLRRLSEAYPALLATDTATLVGPVIEGVGRYPDVDGALGAGVPGLWAAGDCAGAFRGLVAALLSGGYVAEQIRRQTGRAAVLTRSGSG